MKNLILTLSIMTLTISCQTNWKKREKENYIKAGQQIAQQTAKTMLNEVSKHIKQGGVNLAAPYCQANAGTLTNQIADQHKVNIKRSSHKWRNPNNKPTSEEQKIIDSYLSDLSKKNKLSPIVSKDRNGNIKFFAPIILQKKCTVCHGELGNNLSNDNYSTIKKLYPEDNAIGFKEGDLRGIWHITFKK